MRPGTKVMLKPDLKVSLRSGEIGKRLDDPKSAGNLHPWSESHMNWGHGMIWMEQWQQWHMGMGQNLLVSILMGWTSIYQLFCGSLGTRVMTHSHINIHEHCNFHPFSMAMLDYQRVDQNRSEWTLLVNECQWTMMKPCNSIVSAFQSPLRP